MKTIQKILFLICFSLSFSLEISSQSEYDKAIGARVYYGAAFTYKDFISDAGAIELIAAFSPFSYGSLTATAIYEHHFPIGSIEGFHWYVGGGAFAGIWLGDFVDPADDGAFLVGLAGVGGVDYKFANIPLNLSADFIPTISFLGFESGFNFYHGGGGLAARYTF